MNKTTRKPTYCKILAILLFGLFLGTSMAVFADSGGDALQNDGDGRATNNNKATTSGNATIYGTIMTTDGTPLEGVRIYLCSHPNADDAIKTTTDTAGRYILQRPYGGICDFAVHKDGFTGYGALVELLVGEPLRLDVQLEESEEPSQPAQNGEKASIEGVVTDQDGTPLEGVRVYLCSQNNADDAIHTTTDANGHYYLERGYGGTCDFSIYKAGYERYGDEMEISVGESVVLDVQLEQEIHE